MAMLREAGMTLLMSVLALVQLLAFSLAATVYIPILVIVGIANVIYKMATGESFGNIELLTEPLTWSYHQVLVLVGQEDDFWAVPYLGM